MILLAPLVSLCLTASTSEAPPTWILPAIAHCETSSYFVGDNVHRVDHGNDRDSVGVYQCRPIAFADVSRHFKAYTFNDLRSNDELGGCVVLAYIVRWRKPGESWIVSAARWNGGPRHAPIAYQTKIRNWLKANGRN